MFKVGEWVCVNEEYVGRVQSCALNNAAITILFVAYHKVDCSLPLLLLSIRYATLAEVLRARQQSHTQEEVTT